MAELEIIDVEPPRTEDRTPRDRHDGAEQPSDAEGIRRIVEVAEALGISPATAAAVLRDDDGEVSTDVRLRRSIEQVEGRLDGGR